MTDAERCADLHQRGGHKGRAFRVWFARIIDVPHSTVYRWGEDGWPGYAKAVLTLLDLLPVRRWPREWRR